MVVANVNTVENNPQKPTNFNAPVTQRQFRDLIDRMMKKIQKTMGSFSTIAPQTKRMASKSSEDTGDDETEANSLERQKN